MRVCVLSYKIYKFLAIILRKKNSTIFIFNFFFLFLIIFNKRIYNKIHKKNNMKIIDKKRKQRIFSSNKHNKKVVCFLKIDPIKEKFFWFGIHTKKKNVANILQIKICSKKNLLL